MIYTLQFEADEIEQEDWNIEDETFEEDDYGIVPEFCPFCGNHEDDEPTESDE